MAPFHLMRSVFSLWRQMPVVQSWFSVSRDTRIRASWSHSGARKPPAPPPPPELVVVEPPPPEEEEVSLEPQPALAAATRPRIIPRSEERIAMARHSILFSRALAGRADMVPAGVSPHET